MKTCTSALSFPHLVKGTILVCNSTINYTYEMNLYLIFKIFFCNIFYLQLQSGILQFTFLISGKLLKFPKSLCNSLYLHLSPFDNLIRKEVVHLDFTSIWESPYSHFYYFYIVPFLFFSFSSC